jgi:exoribonuclease-2
MPGTVLGKDSLVLYKARPARVKRTGKKLEIELEGGEDLLVRPKDVMLLHSGPLQSLNELRSQVGEVETAWELLLGETTTLAELAELVYGEDTPANAWAAWQLVEDGLYFSGSPEEIVARNPEQVVQEQAARKARVDQERARAAFLDRVRAGQVLPEDGRYLRRVEDLALARTTKSRLLRDLGRAESPESAHALLLESGYWDRKVDPYPQRMGLPTSPPQIELPPLPEEERRDLTHLVALAIDDEDNQEPDDALSLEGDRLWVHVADMAALVPPGSPADLEARARGATLFLPEGTVPMVPWEAIRRLGLGLAEISPALSFGLDLDAAGEISDLEVVPSWVRVTRLTYEEADARLEEEPLAGLYRLALECRARREQRGAVSIDLPEVKMRAEGDEVIIRPVLPLESRELVTGAMLMAGEAVARHAVEQQIPLPFTTQDPPEMDERPRDLAGMCALRRAMRPSGASGSPGSHAGLGLETYVQATSPLRRYLDLVVHQQLRAHLRGEGLLGAQEVLERIGAAASVVGGVRRTERLARRHWTLVYLMQHPGWRGQGILVEKRRRRGTVLVPELDLEARLHLRQDLPLNSPVSLALRGVELATLEAHLRVIDS